VATLARRAGSLDRPGSWAAVGVGTAACAAGWSWAALLIAYFVSSSLLTRLGHARKAARTGSVLPASAARNARQVLANGAVFAGALLGGTLTGDPRWSVAALGALAAAAADTWATELGTLWGGTPRSALTGARLPVGLSGGVTAVGLLAAGLAAALVALPAGVLVGGGQGPAARGSALWLPVAVAGVAGSLVDSVLGAALQARRWCEPCQAFTERTLHACGAPTRHAGGLRAMTNDAVNLLATLAGALLALALAGPIR
jgi:uncharacterized protein (TIGR00297 family)